MQHMGMPAAPAAAAGVYVGGGMGGMAAAQPVLGAIHPGAGQRVSGGMMGMQTCCPWYEQ